MRQQVAEHFGFIMPCKKPASNVASARKKLRVCAIGGWGESNGQGESGWGDEQASQGWGDEDAGAHGAERGAMPEQASCPYFSIALLSRHLAVCASVLTMSALLCTCLLYRCR